MMQKVGKKVHNKPRKQHRAKNSLHKEDGDWVIYKVKVTLPYSALLIKSASSHIKALQAKVPG